MMIPNSNRQALTKPRRLKLPLSIAVSIEIYFNHRRWTAEKRVTQEREKSNEATKMRHPKPEETTENNQTYKYDSKSELQVMKGIKREGEKNQPKFMGRF